MKISEKYFLKLNNTSLCWVNTRHYHVSVDETSVGAHLDTITSTFDQVQASLNRVDPGYGE